MAKLEAKHLIFVAFLVIASSERIVMKMCVDRMNHYTFFLAELLTVLFVIVFFGAVFAKRAFTKDITPAMVEYPKSRFLAMAGFDTTASLLTFIPAAFMSGDLMILLLQMVIPITLAASVLYLKKSYFLSHYVGALVVLAGIALDVIPRLVMEGDSWVQREGVGRVVLYSFLLVLSTVPQTAGGIYKEVAMKQEMDAYYLNAWVSLFQAGLSLAVAPVAFRMQSPDSSLSELPGNFRDGFMCFFAGRDAQEGDHCHGAQGLVVVYIIINLLFNIVITYLFQHGSAVLVWIGMAASVPVSYMAFAIPGIQTPPAKITAWGIVALAVTVGGIVAYNVHPEPVPEILADTPQPGEEAEEKRALLERVDHN